MFVLNFGGNATLIEKISIVTFGYASGIEIKSIELVDDNGFLAVRDEGILIDALTGAAFRPLETKNTQENLQVFWKKLAEDQRRIMDKAAESEKKQEFLQMIAKIGA